MIDDIEGVTNLISDVMYTYDIKEWSTDKLPSKSEEKLVKVSIGEIFVDEKGGILIPNYNEYPFSQLIKSNRNNNAISFNMSNDNKEILDKVASTICKMLSIDYKSNLEYFKTQSHGYIYGSTSTKIIVCEKDIKEKAESLINFEKKLKDGVFKFNDNILSIEADRDPRFFAGKTGPKESTIDFSFRIKGQIKSFHCNIIKIKFLNNKFIPFTILLSLIPPFMEISGWERSHVFQIEDTVKYKIVGDVVFEMGSGGSKIHKWDKDPTEQKKWISITQFEYDNSLRKKENIPELKPPSFFDSIKKIEKKIDNIEFNLKLSDSFDDQICDILDIIETKVLTLFNS